ncbi:glucose 1-dehydrogenase [Synechococcus sp. BA-124 BA4]|uniref:SDR family NAD(P)-dependent oxidoreductase n=1 Tax=unclassified Synechococcus TaxID=2626047 RepID=UPI002AD4862A|nr:MULTISPECIES: glucose 1-dehydrogenase [unclassified Synechococcus]MEA5400048.1 glucose 1-dehydrogenase [Synechococcus sp. BA-124 BA4]
MTTPTVLITGALAGIGRATALAFAREGANVVVSGRREEAGQHLATELRALGARAEFLLADVTDEAQVQSLVSQTVETFGRLDVAVNNAGIEGAVGPISVQTADNYRATFDTNVLGTLLCLKYELPVMLQQGSGSIINLSSIAGQVGMAGASIYVASKHAVEGLTKSAALEVAAEGVRVNAVAPGPVETEMLTRFTGGNEEARAGLLDMMPAKRAASADEIAQTILFLASDKARFLTGQCIAVDGGYTAQ